MSCSFRSILILLAVLVVAANAQAAGKRRSPAHHQVHRAPRHVSHTKVNHHRRPAVNHRSAQRVRQRAPRTVRQSVRRNVTRTVHRYPVQRWQRQFVRRPYARVRHSPHRRYTYFYYPGRYQWRSNHYNRRLGVSRRRTSRGIGGIVESIQGNANNGTLLVKVIRPRSSRFRYAPNRAGAGRSATSLRRFHLGNGTRYEILTAPRRRGTIADLHKGEHVLILTHKNAAHEAQKIEVSPQRKR